jgi:hypothetical protein
MSLLLSIVPITVVLLMIAGAIFAFKPRKKKNNVGAKKIQWMLSGYLVLLVIATLLAITLLPAKYTAGEILSKREISEIEKAQSDMTDSINKGKFNEDDYKKAFVKKKSWSIPYSGAILNVSLSDEENFYSMVVVEQKNSNDGKIDAVYYMGRSIVDGIDITNKGKKPTFKVEDSRLIVGNPEVKEIKMAKFSTGFAFDQFSGKPGLFSLGHNSTHGLSVIHLKVPKGLEIKGFYTSVN